MYCHLIFYDIPVYCRSLLSSSSRHHT